MTRILLVDDQVLVRVGVRSILQPEPGIEIVGECEDGDEVMAAVERVRPDLVIMDIRMRRMSGAEATARLRARPDAPPVLILTTFNDEETVAAALAAGAAGFILKDAAGEDIVRAALRVAQGGSWLDPDITGQVLDAWRRTYRKPEVPPGLELLTQRETDVLRTVGTGATNAEVAGALFISEATVKTHLANVLAKLDLRDRSALIVYTHTHDLLEPLT